MIDNRESNRAAESDIDSDGIKRTARQRPLRAPSELLTLRPCQRPQLTSSQLPNRSSSRERHQLPRKTGVLRTFLLKCSIGRPQGAGWETPGARCAQRQNPEPAVNLVECDRPGALRGLQTLLAFSNRIPGETRWTQVWYGIFPMEESFKILHCKIKETIIVQKNFGSDSMEIH